ncbi:MAG: enoyl-CoA hydratase-related protein [Hyphomonadaceae bacterium]
MQRVGAQFADGRIQIEREGPIGWLTFNQPERLNAVRRDMWDVLPAAVASLVDLGVRAIVVRGAGDKAFISGADIAEFDVQRNNAATNRSFTASVTSATNSLLAAPVPVIAMIKGYCIGGGMVIASACDIRIAAEGSRFGVPAGKLGLGYEVDNLARLQGIVGSALALEMIATARQFTAEEVLRAGFLNRVVTLDSLEQSIRDLVAEITAIAPMTYAAAKLASRTARDPSLNAAAQAAIDACFDSNDFKEGRAAFHARRAPVFNGN